MIDFKISKYCGTNKIDFIQLLLYAYLANKNLGKKINKLSIYNPLLGYEYSINIDNTDIIEKSLDLKNEFDIVLKHV